MWGDAHLCQPGEKPNWSFGDAENNYAHSAPESFIRIGDMETFRRMLVRLDVEQVDAIVARIVELESAFAALEAAEKELAPQRDRVGTAKGALQPFRRPFHGGNSASWCAATIKKIRTENERQHAYGVALLQARLQRDLVKAACDRLHEATEKMIADLPLIPEDVITPIQKPSRDHVRKMWMHNTLCAQSLVKRAHSQTGIFEPFSQQDGYGPMTRWISLQWERFIRGRKGPRTSGGGATMID